MAGPDVEWEMTLLQHERLPAGERLAGPSHLWALVEAGELILTTTDGALPVRSGDALLVDARTPYRLTAATDSDLVFADLRLAVPSPPLPSPFLASGFSDQHPGVAGLVSACPLGIKCQPSLFVVSYASLVGAAMASSWLAAGRDDTAGVTGDAEVAEVVAALATRPGEPWTLDRMASLVHLSRSALTERFRRAVGRSPMQILREVRMHRARKLLEKDSLPVTRIAFEVGYGSVAAFSRAFAAHHDGVPPQEWRRTSSGAGDAQHCPTQSGGARGGRADEQGRVNPVPVEECPARGGAQRDRHLEGRYLQRHGGFGALGLDPGDPQLRGHGNHVERDAPQPDRKRQYQHR
jgi:AraC-like DNA-binding protein